MAYATACGHLDRQMSPKPARQLCVFRAQERFHFRVQSASHAGATRSKETQERTLPKAGGERRRNSILKIEPEIVEQGGLVLEHEHPNNLISLTGFMEEEFIPFSVLFPGLKLLNIDPPIFTVDNFLSGTVCDSLIEAAQNSEHLMPSSVGNYHGNENIRTSSTFAINSEALQANETLTQNLTTILTRAMTLMPLEIPTTPLAGSSIFTKPTAIGQYVFEQPQVTRYRKGEHFLAHNDAFPTDIALEKRYQRRATLLIYLNDVPEGGATYFNFLDLRVQPKKGMAVLFFPAFLSGKPDERTVHTAEDAVTEKWSSQVWVSCGVGPKEQPTRRGPKQRKEAQKSTQKKGGHSAAKPKRKGFGG